MALKENTGVPLVGSLRPKYTTDRFPATYSNENKGGRHVYNSILECTQLLPHERMDSTMQVVIRENREQASPMTTYVLKHLPWIEDAFPDRPVQELPEDFDGSGYTKVTLTEANFFNYFELDKQNGELAGEYIEEFAPNYTGTYYNDQPEWMNADQPPFPYSLDSVWNDANWTTELDPSKHYWKKHRYGTGPASKPYPLFSDYVSGDYVDIRQQFLLAGTVPDTPPYTLADGTLNNEPEGWKDVAVLPVGANINDYRLWEIKAQKNEFGQLKNPWSTPQLVPIDANLIRYNSELTSDPNKIIADVAAQLGVPANQVDASEGSTADTALKNAGWVSVPNHKIHKYRASRVATSATEYSSFTIQKISGESGEYPEFIYREFPENLIDYILDNPNEIYLESWGGDGKRFRPKDKSPAAWKDTAFNAREGYVVFRSSCIKFANGELKTKWSDPVPDGRKNTPIDYIRSDQGNDFKYDSNGVVLNPQIVLTAFLYSGERLINTDVNETVTYDWKRIYNGGGDTTLDATDDFGTQRTATITNDKVDGKAIFRCIQTWTNAAGTAKTFTSEYEILDVKDGLNARLIKVTATSYAFLQQASGTTPAQIDLRVFTENIADNNATPELEFTWMRKPVGSTTWETLADTTNIVNVLPTAFDTQYNEYLYRVEITDSLNVLHYDEVNLHRLSLQNGSDSFSVILSNPRDTVSTNPDGTLLDTGLTNNYTKYQIYEGVTEVTTAFDAVTATVENVVLADPAGDATAPTVSVDIPNKKVSLSTWGTNVTAATVTIRFERTIDAKVLFKDFKLKRQKGYDNLFVLDLDVSPNGTAFAPGDTTAKTVVANVAKNGAYLADADYTDATVIKAIKWFDEKAGYDITTANLFDQTPIGTGRTVDIGPERVDFKNNVICMVELASGQRLTRTVTLTEVADAKKQWMLFAGYKTAPAKESEVVNIYNALGETANYKVDYANETTNGFYLRKKSDQSVISQATVSLYSLNNKEYLFYRSGTSHNLTDAVGVNLSFWVTDDMSKLSTASWADNCYWVCYGKEVNESTVTWGKWIRIKGEGADNGVNGGYKLSYFCVTDKDATRTKPTNSYSPLDADKNEKSSFTDQNGIVWYKDLNTLTYNKDTQRIWEVFTYITYNPLDNKRQFLSWNNPVAITAVNGTSIKGDDGLRGTQWYRGTSLPASGTGENGDYYIKENDTEKYPVYYKANGSWSKIFNMKGNDGSNGLSHQVFVQTTTPTGTIRSGAIWIKV
jgi:hypothetical protein